VRPRCSCCRCRRGGSTCRCHVCACVRVVAAASHLVVCVYMTCCVHEGPDGVGSQLPQQRGCLPVCGSWVVLYSSRCVALLCGGRPGSPLPAFLDVCSGRQRLDKASVLFCVLPGAAVGASVAAAARHASTLPVPWCVYCPPHTHMCVYVCASPTQQLGLRGVSCDLAHCVLPHSLCLVPRHVQTALLPGSVLVLQQHGSCVFHKSMVLVQACRWRVCVLGSDCCVAAALLAAGVSLVHTHTHRHAEQEDA
jgi:hypothetical protein